MTAWNKVIATFTNRKMLIIFLLGISSGLPYLMTGATLGFWLEESSISLKNIGAMALVGGFYNLKFLWSPIVDIIKIPFLSKKLGRRRGWLVFTQIMLILSILGISATSPAENLTPTVIFALLIAFFSATQDIIIDAFRIDSLEEEEQAAGAVPYVYGYRIGLYIAGAVGLILSTQMSWHLVYALLSVPVLIGIIASLMAKEPDYAPKVAIKNTKDLIKHAVIDPFADFVKHKHWLILLLFIIAYKFPGAFLGGGLMSSFYLKMQFSKEEIALAVKTFGMIAGIAGLFIGGLLATKVGLVKALWIDIILQAVTNLLFIPLVYFQGNVWLLTIAVSMDSLAASMGTVVLVGFISGLCNKEYSATQYALLSSLAALGRTLLAANSGWIVEDIGWTNFYVLTFASALPAMLMMPFISSYMKNKENKSGKTIDEQAE